MRSPWADVPVTEVVTLLWQWVSAGQPPRSGAVHAEDDEGRRALVRLFLQADERWLMAFKQDQDATD